MTRTSSPFALRAACAAIAGLLLLHGLASAQDVTEPALKAAFIFNFARFTEWPGTTPPPKAFVICVLGDADVSDALERTVKGRALGGKGVVVVQLARVETQPRACHVLYVSGITAGQAVQLVAGLRDAPVLTISDVDGFTELGGIAQFFFEHAQLRFRIRLDSAKRVHLQISSKLLMLAKQ